MTGPANPGRASRRASRPDLLTLLLAAILVGGVAIAAAGAWSLANRDGRPGSSSLVEPPPTLAPDPGAALGPTGSPPPSAAATSHPGATPVASSGPTPLATVVPSAPTPATEPSPAPSPGPSAAAGYPAIEDAVAAALGRMGIPERFAGECDASPPPETLCGGTLAQVVGTYAWAVGYSGTDFLLGTVVVRQDASGWHPVLFDPGAIVAAGPARVGGTGDCLALRLEPSRDGAQLACLPDGARVALTGVMTVADGYLWAEAEGGGWLPSRWLCGPDCEGVPNTVWSFEPGP